MRSIVAKLVIGSAITAIGMFGADNSIGTWIMNVTKSKLTPTATNPITSLTQVREAMDGGVKVTVTGKLKDGAAFSGGWTAKYDGKDYPVTGAAWDTISIKQVDANTCTFEAKRTGGKYHTTGRTVVSKDGKTMTISSKGTGTDGKPVSMTNVFDKQ